MSEVQPQEKTEFHVPLVKIGEVTKHPNADTLSITSVDGYPVVIRTGDFKPGDYAAYVPVDALVPTDRARFAFLKDGDKPTARIKARRFRGVFSMGLLVQAPPNTAVGTDVAEQLGVTKYLTPTEHSETAQTQKRGAVLARRLELVKLPVYGLDPLRKYAGLFNLGEQVVVSEKIHGTNARFVYHKGRLHVGTHRTMRGATPSRIAKFFTWLKLSAKTLLGIPHRAHVVQRAGDVWWDIAEKYQLEERLAKKPGFALYGEIYGEGVQDLTYDSPAGRKFRAFDVYDMHAGKFLDAPEFAAFIYDIGLSWVDMAPVLEIAAWTEELHAKWRAWADSAPSVLGGNLAEGVVIKPKVERTAVGIGRVAMKYVGAGYLLRKEKEAA